VPTLVARTACTLIAILGLTAVSAVSQKPQQPSDQPDVVRINTELVQTGVVVLDRQGIFVSGLRPEQFQLRVGGRPVTATFFEQVVAGTAREENLLSTATHTTLQRQTLNPIETSYRGRTIIFFIDDLHLSLDSLGRTRSALTYFINKQLLPYDQVAFVAASGQIGFLQKLTHNKAVLRAALARMNPIPQTVLDTDQPPMPEFVALRIVNGDRDAAELYVNKIIEGFASRRSSINRNAVYEMVKTRANNIAIGLESVAATSLNSLDNLVRAFGQIPGRKLVFFISDGFYLYTKMGNSPVYTRIQRVTDAATRTGTVIYTIDARGLFAPIADATGQRPMDPTGRLDRGTTGEGTLSQDGLNALAADTGGRFLKNTNYFDNWLARMLNETANYYLLAWRPEADEEKGGKFKQIEVSIVGRPDLTVRLPRGFFTGEMKDETKNSPAQLLAVSDKSAATGGNATDAAPIAAPGAPSVRGGLPMQLSLSYLDVPNSGPVLTASIEMETNVLGYGAGGKQAAAIDIGGVVLNDHGRQAADFKNRLNVDPIAQSGQNSAVIYNHKLPLKPGLYQVRVGARDNQSGRAGSATDWIEIPDLASKHLTLSSLLVGGQFASAKENSAVGSGRDQVMFRVNRRFQHGARLNFLLLIYNAARGSSAVPDLEAQIKISHNGQAVLTGPVSKVVIDGNNDLARVLYPAEIALKNLPGGNYLLEVTVSDRIAKTSASQEITFQIE
jgi:VWFA-related protein